MNKQDVLEFNKNKNKNLIAYVCVGLPASGKTQYFKDNLGKDILPNTEYVDYFNYAKELIGKELMKSKNKEDYDIFFCSYMSTFKRMLKEDIDRCYKEDKNIYIANCNIEDSERIKLRKYLKKVGYRVKILFFTTDPYTCLKNNRKTSSRVKSSKEEILSYCKDYVFLRYSSKLSKESEKFNEYRNILYI